MKEGNFYKDECNKGHNCKEQIRAACEEMNATKDIIVKDNIQDLVNSLLAYNNLWLLTGFIITAGGFTIILFFNPFITKKECKSSYHNPEVTKTIRNC